MVTVFTGFFSFFNDSGISYVVIREELTISEIRDIDSTVTFVGIVISGIIALLAYPICLFYNNEKLIFLTFALSVINLFGILSVVPTALLKKEGRYKDLGGIILLSNLVATFSGIWLASNGFSYWAIIVSNFVAVLLSAFIYRRKFRLPIISYSLSSAKRGYSLLKKTMEDIALARTIKYWGNKSDNLIIGKTFTANELGIYNRGFQIATLQMNFLSGAINTLMLPELSKIQSDSERKNYIDLIMLFIFFLQAPLAIVLVYYSTQITLMLWGEKWMGVASILPYFAIFSLFYVPINTFGSLYVVNKAEGTIKKVALYTNPIIIITLILSSFFGFHKLVSVFILIYVIVIAPIEIVYAYLITYKYPIQRILTNWLGTFVFAIVIWVVISFDLNNQLLIIPFILYMSLLLFKVWKTYLIRNEKYNS